VKRRPVDWVETLPGRSLPPVDRDLAGWTIGKRRPSHWNAWTRHQGTTFHLKWFLHGRLAAPARTEWRNARRLEALEIPAAIAVGWGRHPRGSFCVLEGSPGFPADEWRAHDLTWRDLLALSRTLAAHVARLHDAGLCHRDLNVYHVLIHDGAVRLIDVGRVRSFTRRRWIIKDLASLLDTARLEEVPAGAARAFLATYLRETRRAWSRRSLVRAVELKARRYRRHNLKHGR
jgi:hypothetical protein